MANEPTATKSASADGEPGVHRLRDILVEEVSLVDRAANKRRFLVVKRSGEVPEAGKPGSSRKADEQAGAAARGGGKKKPKTKPDDGVGKARGRAAPGVSDDEEDDDEELEKARRSGPPWEKDDDVETDKADDDEEDDEVEADKATGDDDDDEEDEEEGSRAADKARPRAKASGAGPAARQQRRGKPTEKADGGEDLVISATVKNAVLRVLAQALERLMGVANRVKEADEPDDETEAYVPDDVTGELEDIGELLEDVAERLPAAKAAPGKAGVAKAGARMAKERLDRFQKALALLADVLKELTDAKQPAEPTGGVAENKLQKRAGEPGLRDLVASVNDLTKIVKRQEDELAGVRKTRATSNAIPVDGGRRTASPDVSWPLDMNRPISRDTVSKSVSFYDEP
jgi:hypothetical protein